MIEVFWYLLLILGFVCVLGLIIVFYRTRMMREYDLAVQDFEKMMRALQLKLNEGRSFVRDVSDSPSKAVGGALGKMGIGGMLKEMGIPGATVIAPFIEGFLSKPENIEKALAVANKMGFKIEAPNAEKSQSQEVGLL
jgi:hypothetical protein